jgi:hypothetical protein
MALRRSRMELMQGLVPYVGWALVLIASVWPISEFNHSIHDLAGKTTNVNVVATVSVTLSIALAGTVWSQRKRIREQQHELERQRGRLMEREESQLEQRGVVRGESERRRR